MLKCLINLAITCVVLGSAKVIREERKIDTECTIAVQGGLSDPQPLLIVPGTEKFLLPLTSSGIIELTLNQQIEFYCSSGFNESTTNSIIASCQLDNKFYFDGVYYESTDFVCNKEVSHTARRTQDTCYAGATVVEIGFEVEDRFLKTIQLCHDEQLDHTYYTQYKFTPANIAFQSGVSRPNFIQGSFFEGRDINDLYKQTTQKATVAIILGSQERADEVILDQASEIFLARGHMAAKADFIFGSHQKTTFYFVNVCPQWQKFNAYNWERVEASSKVFVAANNINVDVYTGTYGVITLADGNGDHQEIYLDFDPNNAARVPIPKIYYKILHNVAADSGIVLIGVNNPHVTIEEIEAEYTFCTDVSDLITWINWDRENILRGYSYACAVDEFNKVTGHLPGLKVTNLLV